MTTRKFKCCPMCGGKYVNQKPLTRIQRTQMTYLQAYIAEHGYAPSFEEIATNFGYSSLATVHEAMDILERKGWIRREFNLKRAITLLHEEAEESTASPEVPA